MKIGKVIQTNRKKFNITQKELAKTLNVSHITVCRWETNKITPTDSNWVILQNLFGLRKDNLVVPVKGNVKVIKPLTKTDKPKKFRTYKGLATKMQNQYKLRRQEIAELKSAGISAVEIAKRFNISRQAVYQLLKKADKEGVPVTYNKHVKRVNICHICNKKFNGSSKDVKTCSSDCRAILRSRFFAQKESKWSRHFFLELTCDNCSKKFTRTKYLDSIAKNAVKHKKHKNNYCSRDCYHNRNTRS